MLGWELPPHNSGGLGVACEGLTQGLAGLGVHIDFLLPFMGIDDTHPYMRVHAMVNASVADKETLTQYARLLASPYMSEEEYSSIIKKTPGLSLYGASLFQLVELFVEYAERKSRELEFDVIHAHDWLTYLAGIRIKEKTGKPLIVHVHATEYDRTGDNPNPRIKEIELLGLHIADAVITVSGHTKKIVASKYHIEEEKIFVVHNGVLPMHPVKRLPPAIGLLRAQGHHIVLFVGRITIQKGPEYFLYMAEKILRYVPKTIFVVSGSGDMEHHMMNLAAELGISQNVMFAGFLRGNELMEVYGGSDVYVMPSVSEPFGITALEAAQHGSSLLLSKQSGAREVIGGAFVADFWDTDEMANIVVNIIRSPGLRKTMRDHAKDDAARATWDLAAEKTLAVYVRFS
jgi:glycosyltransferase involved in cell wall biosynthesis